MEARDKNGYLNRFGKIYKKGTILFKEGDLGDVVYFIHSGRVKIYKVIKGQEKIITVLGKGDFFGEMAILTGRPRSASAELLEDSHLIELDKRIFKEFLKNEPDVSYRMMSVLAQRLERTNRIVENLLLRDERVQVLNALVQIALDNTYQNADTTTFSFNPYDILSKIDVPKEYIKAVLAILKNSGLITIKGKNITVHSIKKIKDMTNFLSWWAKTPQKQDKKDLLG